MKVASIFAICAALLTACHESIVCAGVGVPDRVAPLDTSIAVGTSFNATVETGGFCAPGDVSDARYTKVPVTWRTADSLVVAVNASTGRVTGLRPGDAHLTAVERPADVHLRVR